MQSNIGKILLCGVLAFSMSACTMRHTPGDIIDTHVKASLNCKYKNDPLSSVWKFDCNETGQIVKMTLTTKISGYDIQQAYPKADKDEQMKIFEEYAKKQVSDYDFVKQKFSKKKWLDITYQINEDTMDINTSYEFDVAYEGFDYDLESGIFKDFGLNVLWDSQRKGFYYDEKAINKELFNSAGVCANVNDKDYSIKSFDDTSKKKTSKKKEKSSSSDLSADEIKNILSKKKDTSQSDTSQKQEEQNQEQKQEQTQSAAQQQTSKPSQQDVQQMAQNQQLRDFQQQLNDTGNNINQPNENVSILDIVNPNGATAGSQ